MKENVIKKGEVYEQLRNRIISGFYSPGEKLKERFLSEDFNVSRTPVREALGKLEQEKLIKFIPYQGAMVVNELTLENVKEIYEVHAVLEGLSYRLATQNITNQDINTLYKCIDESEESLKKKDLEEMVITNKKFHNIIYNCSNNSHLVEMIDGIQTKISLLRVKTLSVYERAQENIEEHKIIIKALENKDESMAETLGKLHLINASKTAIKLFKENESKLE